MSASGHSGPVYDHEEKRFAMESLVDELRLWLLKERYATEPRPWVIKQRRRELLRMGVNPDVAVRDRSADGRRYDRNVMA